jgi:hypothetical protein
MNGGPAFPVSGLDQRQGQLFQAVNATGMTLRDYFAAKAMQGLTSNNNTNAQQIAQAAYIVADAMLKERSK